MQEDETWSDTRPALVPGGGGRGGRLVQASLSRLGRNVNKTQSNTQTAFRGPRGSGTLGLESKRGLYVNIWFICVLLKQTVNTAVTERNFHYIIFTYICIKIHFTDCLYLYPYEDIILY